MSTRVMHCIYDLVGGGAETQLRHLLRALPEFGVDSAVFCVRSHGIDKTDHDFELFRASASSPHRILCGMDNAIREWHPDVIHAWLPQSITIPALVLSARHGIPAVYSYRNAMKFHRFLRIPDFACAMLFAKKVVSNNPPEQSNWLYRLLYDVKSGTQISNAVEVTSPYSPKKPGRPLRLAFIGRYTKQKNWMCLLDAARVLDRRGFGFRLRMFGEGEDEHEVRRRVDQLELSRCVQVSGFSDDVPSVLRESDCLLLPSLFEGLPNVVLEAMAHSVPTVVSDIPGHRLFADRAISVTCDPRDPIAFARAVETLNGEWSKALEMTRRAFDFVQTLSPVLIANQYADVYEKVAV